METDGSDGSVEIPDEDVTAKTLQRFLNKWPISEGRALVVGSKVYCGKEDRRKIYQNAIGLDLEAGEGVDIIHDLENPLREFKGSFNHIDCVSVLEHVKRPWKMAKNIQAMMAEGATILVSVPFSWRIHAYPSDYWRITAEALPVLFPQIRWYQRKYSVNGRLRKMVPGGTSKFRGAWIARSELLAFGIKK